MTDLREAILAVADRAVVPNPAGHPAGEWYACVLCGEGVRYLDDTVRHAEACPITLARKDRAQDVVDALDPVDIQGYKLWDPRRNEWWYRPGRFTKRGTTYHTEPALRSSMAYYLRRAVWQASTKSYVAPEIPDYWIVVRMNNGQAERFNAKEWFEGRAPGGARRA